MMNKALCYLPLESLLDFCWILGVWVNAGSLWCAVKVLHRVVYLTYTSGHRGLQSCSNIAWMILLQLDGLYKAVLSASSTITGSCSTHREAGSILTHHQCILNMVRGVISPEPLDPSTAMFILYFALPRAFRAHVSLFTSFSRSWLTMSVTLPTRKPR